MRTRAFLIHALSALHPGTGAAADVIDLPIARQKATGIPYLPGSSIKGVLRDARRSDPKVTNDQVEAVFGPEERPEAHAGALVVGDARLLALPVRSFRGTFAWVTSPLLLLLAGRDLGGAVSRDVPNPGNARRGAWVPEGCICVHGGRIYLEDLDLLAEPSECVMQWAKGLAALVSPGVDIFSHRFVVVDDETMSFLWQTATQVDARVRIGGTGTVAKGALWLEESLPPETVLIGVMAADRSRRPGTPMSPEEVLGMALPAEEVLQFGGKASTGRGRCRIVPVQGVDQGVA